MAWQFILTDLLGNVHGEVTQADERSVSLPHMRVPSASFKLPLWHPLAATVMDTDCLLRCYRTDEVAGGAKRLAFHGPVVSAEEVGENLTQSISVTSAGPFWRLTKRIIPGSDTKPGYGYGSEASPQYLGAIAHNILTTCNGDLSGYGFTGIQAGSLTTSMTNPFVGGTMNMAQGGVGPWHLKNAGEAIAELSAGISSFEYILVPEEPTYPAGSFPRIARMDIAPVVGANRPDAIFEYGTTRANVASYSRSVSRDQILTRAIMSVQGWPDPPVKDDSTDPDTYYELRKVVAANLSTRGLFEEQVNEAGVLEDDLRDRIGNYHLYFRKDPRQIIKFRPSPRARPAPFTDYEVGDMVRARAVVRGSLRFDALFRIWGLTFSVDKNGNENVELELAAA